MHSTETVCLMVNPWLQSPQTAKAYMMERAPSGDQPVSDIRDAASSSGSSSNPPESRATGALFGQSPAPELLLARKSGHKARPNLLPSFSEVRLHSLLSGLYIFCTANAIGIWPRSSGITMPVVWSSVSAYLQTHLVWGSKAICINQPVLLIFSFYSMYYFDSCKLFSQEVEDSEDLPSHQFDSHPVGMDSDSDFSSKEASAHRYCRSISNLASTTVLPRLYLLGQQKIGSQNLWKCILLRTAKILRIIFL